MKNREKYGNILLDAFLDNERLCITKDTNEPVICNNDCKNCLLAPSCELDKLKKWANEECKPLPLLNNKEKEYIQNIIKPFKDKVKYIAVRCSYNNDKQAYLEIAYKEYDNISHLGFPDFIFGTIYKGLKLDKTYTIEELGLEDQEDVKD